MKVINLQRNVQKKYKKVPKKSPKKYKKNPFLGILKSPEKSKKKSNLFLIKKFSLGLFDCDLTHCAHYHQLAEKYYHDQTET